MKEAFGQRCVIWLGLFLLSAAPTASWAGTATLAERRIYVRQDTLTLDIAFDSLFSQRVLDAIASGMTTSIVLEFQLMTSSGRKTGPKSFHIRLDHDIWEGEFRVHRHISVPETLLTADFEAADSLCSHLEGIALARVPTTSEEIVLKVRANVDPISPEQERRTRKWLNLLEKGSFLELFISLNRPSERTPWLEAARFRVEDLQ
ncbi:MAG: hypothetical protein QGI83_10675 [Candidatus Latescibacteria bacterium]|jgi:hypothetical protein|nr:hypothetical protein [Candidatus Latescibacterota bacterium]